MNYFKSKHKINLIIINGPYHIERGYQFRKTLQFKSFDINYNINNYNGFSFYITERIKL